MKEWTGIILAGGLSSRMGSNKALLTLDGSIVLEHVASAIAPAVSRVIVAAGPNVGAYQALGYTCVEDGYPGKGPLAGLHAALEASETEWNLVCACDMPLVQPSLFTTLQRLAASDKTHRAIVPRLEGRVHPLVGIYHIDVLPSLEQCLIEDRLRVTRWLDEVGCRYVEAEDLERAGVQDAAAQLINMNTMQDYRNLVGNLPPSM
ncbi:molybdenum cofactor guanylyltransferase [Paenibacillus sp. 7523-1]|uniref:molybdenum cofactor guanylyltransferase n=1 Tax=Paenibacillus sp. 7523-1 TaxID=2022550 RepID=UPI001140AC1B|nr:molybdenum cofactor guanylyltransferase [Paenibacillus sp. 7523-1]